MSKYRNLDAGDVFPASWTDALQEFIGSLSSNVRINEQTSTSIRVPAGSGSAQVGIGIDGLWRWRSTNVDASVPGGAGTYDIFATATANSFATTPTPDTDSTDYNFGLELLLPPATPSGGGIAAYRKIGEVDFDGTAITEVRNWTDGGVRAHADSHSPGASDELDLAAISAALALSASDLTNGVTGTGAVALAGSPTFTGTLTAAAIAATTFSGTPAFSGNATAVTQAVDNNTTRIATTAFVIGQGYLKSAAAASTYATLASPALTGTPTAPTAAVDTTTTQIATTAFVLGQLSASGDGTPAMDGTASRGTGSHGARADHVHPTDTTRAPLASPTFTGTPAAPTAAVDTSTTQIATTAYVVNQGYLKSATAASTYAPLASPTFTGVVTVPVGSATNPSITFAGDTDTGIYHSAANALSIATNGAIAATFSAGGDLNILGVYKIGGTQIAASNLSNGTTGSGAVALAGGPTFTGTPAAPTAAVDTNTTQIATTAYVLGQLSASGDGTPAMDGTAARGTSSHGARADHVHATDTSRAPLASPTFTGTPAAPTPSTGTNTTQLATTAFVLAQIAWFSAVTKIASTADVTVAVVTTSAALTATFTAPRDGVYEVRAVFGMQYQSSNSPVESSTGNGRASGLLYKNGSPAFTTAAILDYEYVSGQNASHWVGGTFAQQWTITLVAGDTLDLRVTRGADFGQGAVTALGSQGTTNAFIRQTA